MRFLRVILAFLLAPLVVPTIAGIVHYLELPPDFPDAERVALNTAHSVATISYVVTLASGLPTYLFLKYRKWLNFTSIMLTSTIIAAVMKFRFQAEAMQGMPTHEWLYSLQLIAYWAASGALIGVTFWVLTHRNVQTAPAKAELSIRAQNSLVVLASAAISFAVSFFVWPLTLAVLILSEEVSGGFGGLSKPLTAIQIEYGERDPGLLVTVVKTFGKAEGFDVRGGKYPDKAKGHELDMTLTRRDGTRIEIKSGTKFQLDKRPGEYDAVFYTKKDGANWEEARSRFLSHLHAELSSGVVIRQRDPAYPRLAPP